MDRQIQLMGLSVMIFIALRSLYVIPRMVFRRKCVDEEGKSIALNDKPGLYKGLLITELVFGVAAWVGVIIWLVKLV